MKNERNRYRESPRRSAPKSRDTASRREAPRRASAPRKVQRRTPARTQRKHANPIFIVVALLIVAVVIGGLVSAFLHRSIPLTINDKEVSLPANTTIKDLDSTKYSNATPGNYLSVSGNVLKEGGGKPIAIIVNGEALETKEELSQKIHKNDIIEFQNGENITEELDVEEYDIPSEAEYEDGAGALIFVDQVGAKGKGQILKGKESGETVDEILEEPKNTLIKRYNVEPDDDKKLVALTFDDGPSQYTDDVLKVLDDKDVKATFFMLGDSAVGNPEMVKTVASKGHQVCPHSMSHDNYFKLSDEELNNDIDTAFDTFNKLAGSNDKILRPPYGNFDLDTWKALLGKVNVVVGWNKDSLDWRRQGVSVIVSNSTSAKRPGDIILLHDGGGKREQTIEALPLIIDDWKADGYTFVTISELIASDSTIPKEVLEKRK